MLEKTKKQKKGSISEEDMSTLLQRYTATTVLGLLQEVAQFPDVKIDWNALVKKTSTGISNAREYQMLWRHLAYRHATIEKLEDGAEPMDDDSDLEYDLEAFPAVSSEASTEAAACVKVLIASGLASDSNLPNSSTVEAPLTINIPNGQSSRAPSEASQLACFMQGTNITVPVSVQKQPLPAVTSAEGLDANGLASSSLPPRRKRKPWSAAEDMELIAAVQKCGEGNWANILKGDFKGDRTASQLSQRWAIIRKRHGNLNVGGANATGTQLSQAQLAARHAMSLALNMPVGNLTASCSVGTAATNSNNVTSNPVFPAASAEALPGSGFPQTQHQSQQGPISASSRLGSSGSAPKSRVTLKKPSLKSNISPTSNISPNSMVKATAVAAGARIATQEDVSSLLKAAQAKNAIHIMPGGGSLIKSSMPGGANPLPTNHLGAHHNVHYVCTGLSATPLSTYPSVTPSASRSGSAKPAAPTVQISPSNNAASSVVPSEQTNSATSNLVIELSSKQEVKTAEETEVSGSGNTPKEQVQGDQACVSGNAPSEQDKEDQTALSVPETVAKNQLAVGEIPTCSLNMETAENDQATTTGNLAAECKNVNDSKTMISPVREGCENQSAVKENCENHSGNEKQMDLPSVAVNGSSDVEVLGEAVAGSEL